MEETIKNPQTEKRPLIRPVQKIPEQKPEVNYRIKWWMAIFLVSFAVLIDVAELLITWAGVVAVGGLISTLISIIGGFTFWLWYLLLRVPAFGNPKQLATRSATFIIEIIPLLDAIPILAFAWTIGTIISVVISRSEDKGGVLGKLASGAVAKKPTPNFVVNRNSLDALKEGTKQNLDWKNQIQTKPQPTTRFAPKNNVEEMRPFSTNTRNIDVSQQNMKKESSSNNVLNIKENERQKYDKMKENMLTDNILDLKKAA